MESIPALSSPAQAPAQVSDSDRGGHGARRGRGASRSRRPRPRGKKAAKVDSQSPVSHVGSSLPSESLAQEAAHEHVSAPAASTPKSPQRPPKSRVQLSKRTILFFSCSMSKLGSAKLLPKNFLTSFSAVGLARRSNNSISSQLIVEAATDPLKARLPRRRRPKLIPSLPRAALLLRRVKCKLQRRGHLRGGVRRLETCPRAPSQRRATDGSLARLPRNANQGSRNIGLQSRFKLGWTRAQCT